MLLVALIRGCKRVCNVDFLAIVVNESGTEASIVADED